MIEEPPGRADDVFPDPRSRLTNEPWEVLFFKGDFLEVCDCECFGGHTDCKELLLTYVYKTIEDVRCLLCLFCLFCCYVYDNYLMIKFKF